MKKRQMYFKMVLNSLLRRRSRMLVALLAIAIGATVMSGMVMIYYDIPRQLGKEFRSYGANFVVLPQGDQKIMKSTFEEIKSFFPPNKVVGIAPYRYETTKINQKPYILAGTNLDEAKKNSPFWFIEGSWVTQEDNPNQVMVGKEIAKTIGLHVGDTFKVEGVKYGRDIIQSNQNENAETSLKKSLKNDYYVHEFTVKGIITTGGVEEGFIFLNLNELDNILEDKMRLDSIECSIEASQTQLNQYGKELHQKIASVVARPVKRVTQSQDTVLGKLKALVLIVNVVVLLLTMITVLTTMVAVITERRKEIGLKKALGAPDQEIVKEFLGEGIGLGFLGGSIGVVLGYFFAQRVSLSVFGRAIEFSLWLIPATLLVSILITLVASWWPVKQATKVDPALVLRGE